MWTSVAPTFPYVPAAVAASCSGESLRQASTRRRFIIALWRKTSTSRSTPGIVGIRATAARWRILRPIPMRGGTTFHFETDGSRAALDRAFAAAGGKDVRLGGGAATIREYLRSGLVDELHVVIVPMLLGEGERLFDDVDEARSGLRCV